MSTPNPTPTQQSETLEPNVHALTVLVCQDCIDLKGTMCNNPQCVFCRRTMVEVQRYLDVMLLCPIVDGKRLILVGDAVTSEDTRAAVAGPPNEGLRSACCDAPTRIANTDYNVCTACKEACDTVTAATSSPAPAEKLPLPTDYECIAPPEQVIVINLLRGICGADKQEAAQLHLSLCARCQELAGGVVPAESKGVAGEQEIGPLQLYDRADGVKGHFCVGRKVTGCGFDYNEFWNRNKFCSAGEVFIGKEAAEAKLNELSRPSDSARRAAEEIHKLCDKLAPEIPGDSTSYAPSIEQIAAIIRKHFAVAPADNDAGSKGESDA